MTCNDFDTHDATSSEPACRQELKLIELGHIIPANLAGLWYVAHTRARNEKALVADLARMRIPAYLPLMRHETRSRRTNRITRNMVPVFPGYLFFNATQDQRYQSLTTNRIAKLLIVPEQKQLVAELQRIQHFLQANQTFTVKQRLEVGQWGRITTGPLQGTEGVVARSAGRWRLSMNVTILGQSVHVEVDRDHVERIDPPSWYSVAKSRRS
jgi:transcription antitermination factor NusG